MKLQKQQNPFISRNILSFFFDLWKDGLKERKELRKSIAKWNDENDRENLVENEKCMEYLRGKMKEFAKI